MSKEATSRFVPRTRKVRILATLGPASDSPAMIRRLVEAGADAFRINMSHGSHADHEKRIAAIRALESELERPTTILADLQGPKLRVGKFRDDRAELKNGHTLSIAVDVAGRTPMHFLGRDLVGSFGAPRFAMETGAPVVIMTAELVDERDTLPLVRIHPPLYPEDYADAHELLEAMLELHEPYIVKWPELYDIPLSHWGFPPTDSAQAAS